MTKAYAVVLTGLVCLGLFFVSSAKVSAITADHVVISQVQIDGVDGTGGTSQDFIELYNPTASVIDLSGWNLRKKTKSDDSEKGASIRVFPSDSIIPAFGYFLWANSGDGYADSVQADVSSAQSIAANNSIALYDNEDNLVDALAWGEGHTDPFVEGQAFPENPDGAKALKRTADTDNNSADFEIGDSDPRNSQSEPESEDTESDEGAEDEVEETEEEGGSSTGSGSSGGFALELSEVMPNPDGTDSGNEWIELYNAGGGQVDLGGWILDDEGLTDEPGRSAYKIPDGTVLDQGGYLAVIIPKGRFALNNNGDAVRLFDPSGNPRLELRYPGPAKSGWSYARTDQNQWEWTGKPTPGERNSFPAEPVFLTTVKVTEALPNPVGDDVEGEFIELHNFGSDAVDLNAWVIMDARKRFTVSEKDFFDTEINPGEYLVLWREVTGIALNNTGEEEVKLMTPAGDLISHIVFTANGREGESFAEATSGAYQWTELPTPGEKNEIRFESEEDEIENPQQDVSKTEKKTKTQNRDAEKTDAEILSVELSQIRELERGMIVSTSGIVSAPLGVLEEQVLYLAGSGIRVFFSELPTQTFPLGDRLSLTGEVSSFHNELQLKVLDTGEVEILETGARVEPLLVSTGEIGENLEGFLVTVRGVVASSQGDTFFIDDGTGEARILIRASTRIEKPRTRKGDEVMITGIVSQFNANHRILPRFQEDIVTGQVLGENPLPRTGRSFWLSLAVFWLIWSIFLTFLAYLWGKNLSKPEN